MIKLVNFIRSEIQSGNLTPDLSSKSAVEDDRYLQPVLEDDVLLYSLEEVIGVIEDEALPAANANGKELPSGERAGALDRIIELERAVQRIEREFSKYRETVRETVNKTLEHRWNSTHDADKSTNGAEESGNEEKLLQDDDTHYFSSYSTNGELL